MKTRFSTRRKGMTLAGMMIVIVVIAVLATMMMYSSTEAIATAKATTILTNLQILKRATIQWYLDNREYIQPNGTVKIGDEGPHPIQEWSEDDIQLSRYISAGDMSKINLHYGKKNDKNTGNINTNLQEGCYGICDGGRVFTPDTFDENGKATNWTQTEHHRNAWYVGYRFEDNEGAVRKKIKSRMESAGVFLGTADAHEDTYNNNSAAVWMRAL